MKEVQRQTSLPPLLSRRPEGLADAYTSLVQVLRRAIDEIAWRLNHAITDDGETPMTAPLRLKSYTVSSVPSAGLWTGALIFVSNEAGGATIAFSDGTNWRRVQDRAVIS